MGLDLQLLPVEADRGSWGFSHTVLNWGSGYEVQEWIKDKPLTDPPDNFSTFLAYLPSGDPGYGKTTETPYGEPLRCIRVKYLLQSIPAGQMDVWLARRETMKCAILAFLQQLDPEMKVALFWH